MPGSLRLGSTRSIGVGAVLCLALEIGASPARGQTPPENQPVRTERAWSSWTTIKGARVAVEALRVGTAEEEITYGRIARMHCRSPRACVGTSVARMIAADSFELATDLSEGHLAFSVLGRRSVTDWRSDEPVPFPTLGTERVNVRRSARASGRVQNARFRAFHLRRARMAAGTEPPSELVAPPLPTGPGFPRQASTTCWNYRKAERTFAKTHNDLRRKHGKPVLRLDPELSRVARGHTRAMVAKDLLQHSSTVQLTTRVKGWILLGENVGVGGTPASLMDAFMASPGHRANVLHDSFTYFGLGTKRAAGRLWVTAIFEAKENPTTSLAMPSC